MLLCSGQIPFNAPSLPHFHSQSLLVPHDIFRTRLKARNCGATSAQHLIEQTYVVLPPCCYLAVRSDLRANTPPVCCHGNFFTLLTPSFHNQPPPYCARTKTSAFIFILKHTKASWRRGGCVTPYRATPKLPLSKSCKLSLWNQCNNSVLAGNDCFNNRKPSNKNQRRQKKKKDSKTDSLLMFNLNHRPCSHLDRNS